MRKREVERPFAMPRLSSVIPVVGLPPPDGWQLVQVPTTFEIQILYYTRRRCNSVGSSQI
jgi:hypothetical protein